MVNVKKDLTKQKFGRLTVIEQADDYINPKGRHCAKWLCQCECGNVIEVVGTHLKNGNTKSCGCIRKEQCIKRNSKSNTYEIYSDYVKMYTIKGEPFFIDLDDFDKVKIITWHRNNEGYIYGKLKRKNISLHRYVMNCPDNMTVDHIHGALTRNDCRKNNLRIATRSQNGMNKGLRIINTSGITGVSWHNLSQKWRARIMVNGKEIYLGLFTNFNDAVEARKKAEEKYFGEWSYDNSQRV